MKSKVTCRAQPAVRLAAASALYTTRMLRSSEGATISLCAKAVLALVFTTLRDTSFKYTNWYSFNSYINLDPWFRIDFTLYGFGVYTRFSTYAATVDKIIY
jgi:hypothetical protein